MTTRNLCLALLVTAVIPASSSVVGEQVFGVPDSVVCSPEHSAEHHNLFINTQNSWFHNPALHFDDYGSTYGNLGIYADKRREDEAFVMQEGNALYNIGIRAASYRRLYGKDNAAERLRRSMTVVWGEASYQNGRRDNVEWNTSSDWSTIYPYVLCNAVRTMDDRRGTDIQGRARMECQRPANAWNSDRPECPNRNKSQHNEPHSGTRNNTETIQADKLC